MGSLAWSCCTLTSRQTTTFRPIIGEALLWLGAQQGTEGALLPFRGDLDDVSVCRGELPENVVKVLAW